MQPVPAIVACSAAAGAVDTPSAGCWSALLADTNYLPRERSARLLGASSGSGPSARHDSESDSPASLSDSDIWPRIDRVMPNHGPAWLRPRPGRLGVMLARVKA